MSIDYDHSQNLHTTDGPRAALPLLFAGAKPQSLLDVGCGTGTWLKAAMALGIQDVFGVDGVDIPPDKLLIPQNLFRRQDLTIAWNLGRRFDAALCLEVGEHLDASSARTLVGALTDHADCIFFSAACPGQPGQHHVNCQWPGYWQNLFNQRAYACSDSIRWEIWDNRAIESWYRQNMFCARKNPQEAGHERRLPAVLHPQISDQIILHSAVEQIKDGRMSLAFYAGIPFVGLKNKVMRRLS